MQAGLRRYYSLRQSRAKGINLPGLSGDISSQEVEPATAYLNRGRSLLARRDYVGAIGDFDRVIWVASDCRVAYYHRAVCLLAVGDFEQAALDLVMAQDLARKYQDGELLQAIDQTRAEIPQPSLIDL
jgi:tetratricopeptide (TPR) repeat protein